ncbi:MAG TPA: ABC transporter permease [Gemmatimonadaceae bacterium]|nr:ABC transporter permease [Gemmatimonadaceae bacterium]
MAEYLRTKPRGYSERVYRALLHAYPRGFRDEFGDAMIEFHRDRLAQARLESPVLGIARVWLNVAADLLRNALPARIDALRATPSFRKEDLMLSSVMQDVRFALRGIRKSPGFSVTVLATLALGIGASVATFSAVNGVLLQPLPFRDASRLVQLQHDAPYQTVSEPEFVDYRRDAKSLGKVAAYFVSSGMVAASGAASSAQPERVRLMAVSDDFFATLGAPVFLGRTFTAEEEKRGGPGVVIISYGFWMRRFAGDSSAVGKTIVMNDKPRTVVGVLAPGAEFPSPDISVWSPLRLNYDTLWTRNNHYLSVIGRLAPNATVQQASAEVRSLARRMSRDFPDVYMADKPLVASVMPLLDHTVAEVRPYLVTLFGAVLFVLLIACVNVANLLLARGEARRKELAIRSAMGATGFRVARQAFAESLLLAAVGGVAGVALAAGAVRVLRTLVPDNVPRANEIAIDPPVLFFALGVTLITGVLFGMMPAVRSARSDAAETLKEGGKTSSTRGLGRLRSALVISEVALSVVTLAGAGLMLRSLWNLQAVDLGFNPDHVLAVSVSPPVSYTPVQALALYRRVEAETRALPGVVKAASVESLPIAECCAGWSILIDNAPQTSVANAPAATPQKVTPGYFEVMRVGLVRGRTFEPSDDENAPLVAVVNETMARTMWPGRDAIGGTVKMLWEKAPRATVVGVVRDERIAGLVTPPPAIMYFPQAQADRSAYYVPTSMWVMVRTSGDPAAIAPAVREIIRRAEPLAAIARVQTMDQVVSASVAPRRFATALIAGFAGVALLLAGIGIYGVIAYSVSQRKYEIGLRLALGATPRGVVRQILGEGLRTALIGAAAGLAVALLTTRLLRAMFVEVSVTDPATLMSVTLLLVIVAMAASWLPARRASAVDPLGAMK